jgi:hypothetical protein
MKEKSFKQCITLENVSFGLYNSWEKLWMSNEYKVGDSQEKNGMIQKPQKGVKQCGKTEVQEEKGELNKEIHGDLN